jgi:hypothetical protein
MSSIQYVAQFAGHVALAAMMLLLVGRDASDVVKFGVVASVGFGFVAEHTPDLIPERVFPVLDPATTLLFLGHLFYSMYKKHGRVANKSLVKALVGIFVGLYAFFIAIDFPGLPKDAYGDRLAQLHTSAYDNNHHVLHFLLVALLYVMNSAPDSPAAPSKPEVAKKAA